MKLIILYGPPASGKYTIAKTLAQKTGFPLLHNHLIADFSHALFAYGTREYVRLAVALRQFGVQAAIRAKIPGLILTFAYGLETIEGKQDAATLQRLTRLVKKHGGSVHFIQLRCDDKTLLQRVSHSDRKKFQKLTDKKILQHILEHYDVRGSIPFQESLVLDTSKLRPATSVQRILASFH